jgi:hypothetical protein
MVSTMDQWNHLIVTLQNDFNNLCQAVEQEIAQEAAVVEQQWDHLLGIVPNTPSPSPAAVQSPGSGSGSGSSAMTTAANSVNQPLATAAQKSGSGSGSGAATTVHEAASTPAISRNASPQGMMPLVGSGSGSGGGSGSGSTGIGSARVYGSVWLDNNGDGSIDNGEQGFSGVTVNLVDAETGLAVMSTTTDAGGNYVFYPVNISQGTDFEIQVVFVDGEEATIPGADSQIDANGFSPAFFVGVGANLAAPPAGLRSMEVTTTQDDANAAIKDHITLRDAIETGQNGGGNTVTFKQGVAGTISLQAALPALTTNVTIAGPGSSILTVQGNGNAGNPYQVFNVIATAEIDGLTITGGFVNAGGGGGIRNSGSLTLSNDVVENNIANNGPGGGIYNGAKGQLTLISDYIYLNSAQTGGGIYNLGTMSICCDSQIFSNAASVDGGGVFNRGNAELFDNTQIYGNSSGSDGGGVYNESNGNNNSFIMHGGSLSSNDAGGSGGGFFNDARATLDTNLMVQKNEFAIIGGGGMYLKAGSTTTINNVTIQGNQNPAGNGAGFGVYQQRGAIILGGAGVVDSDDPNGQPYQGP